ncbi:MAG: diguanylate cyclase [Gemmatimonadaceae bacterium]
MQLRVSLTGLDRFRRDGAFLTAWLASPRAASFCIGAAVVVLGSAFAHSALAALAACAIVAVTWRVEQRWGLVAGAIAIALLGIITAVHRADAGWVVVARLALLLGAMLIPEPAPERKSGYKGPTQRAGRRREPDSGGSPLRRSPSAAAAKATQWTVKRSGVIGDQEVEANTIGTFLDDLRDAIGVTQVTLWRMPRDGSALTEKASSSKPGAVPASPIDEQSMRIVRWAAQEQMPVSSPADEPNVLVAAPVLRNGQPYGVLSVASPDDAKVNRDRLKTWLTRYAVQAGTLVELVEASRTATRYARHVEDLLTAASRIQSNLQLDALGEAICEASMRVTGASRAAFAMWEPATETGRLVTVSPRHPVEQGFAVTSDSLIAMVSRAGQRFTFEDRRDLGAGTTIYGRDEAFRSIGSLAVVPLMRDTQIVGAIVVEGDDIGQITHVEAQALAVLASLAGVAMETCEQFEEINQRAFFDALTGIPNRRKFDEQLSGCLAQCDRFGTLVTLVMVDIDHFKSVNDRFGHSAGDQVLKQVASTLSQHIRDIDVCARYGGEEMAILLPQTSSVGGQEVAERLRNAIEGLQITVGGQRIPVTASFGVASYPDIARSRSALVESADRALYEAKCAGRNCVKSSGLSLTGKEI